VPLVFEVLNWPSSWRHAARCLAAGIAASPERPTSFTLPCP